MGGMNNMNVKLRITGFLLCMCLLTGYTCAEYTGDGSNIYYGGQDPGIAEPFYPGHLPQLISDQSGGSQIQAGPGTGFAPEPLYSGSQPVPTPMASNPQVISVGPGTPVGNVYQDPGTAEPYYPANPPEPAPEYTQEPVWITPPGPVTPEPTPYPQTPVYSPPVTYREIRYEQPVTIYTGRDNYRYDRYHSDNYRYDDRNYRPSYYDYDDCDYRYSSYYCVDGMLKIASTPHQAEIYVDNRFRGYTPYSGYKTLEDIRPGTYTVRLKYSGYYDYYEDVYVPRGRTVYLDADMVRISQSYSETGSISVQSDPSGAQVFLDNEYRGFSPVVLSNVRSGSHSLVLKKDGFADYISKVDISRRDTESISAVLTPSAPPTQVPTVPPTQVPIPQPTKSSINVTVLCFALVIGGILVARIRSP